MNHDSSFTHETQKYKIFLLADDEEMQRLRRAFTFGITILLQFNSEARLSIPTNLKEVILCDVPWSRGERSWEYSWPPRQTPQKFYRQSLASGTNRWGTVLDFEQWKSGNGHGSVCSARIDGERGLACLALCTFVWPIKKVNKLLCVQVVS